MPTTKTITLYKFDELSEEAQATAIDKYRQTTWESGDYAWDNENIASRDAFTALFPVKLVGRDNDMIRMSGLEYDEIEEFTGIRLAKYIWNNYKTSLYKGKFYHSSKTGKIRHSKITLEHSCVLTGYYMDNEILQPVYDFMNKPNDRTNFEQLMYECLQAWEKAWQAARDHEDSDEYIKETIEANDYDFTEDGEME